MLGKGLGEQWFPDQKQTKTAEAKDVDISWEDNPE